MIPPGIALKRPAEGRIARDPLLGQRVGEQGGGDATPLLEERGDVPGAQCHEVEHRLLHALPREVGDLLDSQHAERPEGDGRERDDRYREAELHGPRGVHGPSL